MAAGDKIIDLFTGYQDVLSGDQQHRETIYEIVRDLEKISREISTTQQRIHLDLGLQQVPEILSKTKDLLESCGPLFHKLSETIPKNEFYKYHDSWKFVTQRLVFAAALRHFLLNQELLLKEDAAQILSLKPEPAEGFHLDLEDYLHGLLSLTSELARLSVTSATSGDYQLPIKISSFVSELNAGFMLMNFKNDSLRKRYDALKYDQKKIEEIVYDLSIRGLKPGV
uniref:Translin n=1 Tax=Lygus hesperus TaxID=30085 RepID=A0A0A9XTH9_LYGHE